MSAIDSIRVLLNKLSPDEIRIAKRYVVGFKDRNGKSDSKPYILLTLIIDDKKELSEKEIENIIYKNNKKETNTKKTFNRMILRLKSRVLESLILDVNIERKEAYSEQHKWKYTLQKISISASIVHAKGLMDLAEEMYDRLIEKATEFEMYEILIETLYLKQQLTGLKKGRDRYDSYTRQIAHYEVCRASIYKSRNYYHQLISQLSFKSNYTENLIWLKNSINELQQDWRITHSANVGYYLHFIKIQYYEELLNYEKAVKVCHNLAKLIKNNKAIYTKRALALAYLELSNMLLFCQRFEEALINTHNATNLIVKNNFNFALAKEMEFYALFYLQNYENAMEVIDKLIEITTNAFRKDKRIYFKACVLFLMGNYKEVHRLLHTSFMVEDDKFGWNIGMRVLSILNDLEQLNLNQKFEDAVEKKINNLQKHITRLKTQIAGIITPRQETISFLLCELAKLDFDYSKLFALHSEQIRQLKNISSDYAWKIKSSEMVVFHNWLQTKVST